MVRSLLYNAIAHTAIAKPPALAGGFFYAILGLWVRLAAGKQSMRAKAPAEARDSSMARACISQRVMR